MTPEGRVKKEVKKILAAFNIVAAGSKRELQEEDESCAGWYYMPVKGTSFGVNGIHDFVGCANGLFFSIETKQEGNSMTPNQTYRARGVQRGKGKFFLIDGDMYALTQWLKEATNG